MSSLKSLNVLLVDDNQNMRAIAAAVLHSADIRNVKEAEEGAAAFDLLRRHPIDLAIVDFNMFPAGRGRVHPPGPHQPRQPQRLSADHHDDRPFRARPRL